MYVYLNVKVNDEDLNVTIAGANSSPGLIRSTINIVPTNALTDLDYYNNDSDNDNNVNNIGDSENKSSNIVLPTHTQHGSNYAGGVGSGSGGGVPVSGGDGDGTSFMSSIAADYDLTTTTTTYSFLSNNDDYVSIQQCTSMYGRKRPSNPQDAHTKSRVNTSNETTAHDPNVQGTFIYFA